MNTLGSELVPCLGLHEEVALRRCHQSEHGAAVCWPLLPSRSFGKLLPQVITVFFTRGTRPTPPQGLAPGHDPHTHRLSHIMRTSYRTLCFTSQKSVRRVLSDPGCRFPSSPQQTIDTEGAAWVPHRMHTRRRRAHTCGARAERAMACVTSFSTRSHSARVLARSQDTCHLHSSLACSL